MFSLSDLPYSIDHDVTNVVVRAVVADSTATMKLNGATLSSGVTSAPLTLSLPSNLPTANVLTLRVTAQDGTTVQTYTITLTASAIPTVVANTPCASVSGSTLPALLRSHTRSLYITVPGGQNYEFLHVSASSNVSAAPVSLYLR